MRLRHSDASRVTAGHLSPPKAKEPADVRALATDRHRVTTPLVGCWMARLSALARAWIAAESRERRSTHKQVASAVGRNRCHPLAAGSLRRVAPAPILSNYPPDVSSPGTSSDTAAKPVWLPVAAVVVSGLVVNWLSDAISVSPPILILLAAVALVLLVGGERSSET